MDLLGTGTPLRYAAFDLDGTLLDDTDRPVRGIESGLRRVREQGLIPILVTGRTLAGFTCAGLPQDFLDCFDDHVLLYEGDAVYDLASRALRPRLLLPAGLVPAAAAAYEGEIVIEVDGSAYAGTRRAAVAYAMAYRIPRDSVAVGPPSPGSEPIRLVAFGDGPRPRVDLSGWPVRATPIRPFRATVLSPRAGGKATGLAAHLGGGPADTGLEGVIAFGDGDNDASLLARSTVGVAVRHASSAAVAAASVHLTESIADFLQRLDRHRIPLLGVGDTT